MTQPTPGSWPPQPFDEAQEVMRVWAAWYNGDTTALHAIYSGASAPKIRPSQMVGGVVGAVARFWWGRPQRIDQPRHRIHVPLPKDIATLSADTLLSESPRIVAPGEETDTVHQAQQKRYETLINTPTNYAALLEAAEIGSALGTTYLSLTWDTEVADTPILVPQDGDAAVPEFRMGILRAVTFWTNVTVTNDGIIYRHTERHEVGAITHQLWRTTSNDVLGSQVPLESQPATEWVANVASDTGTSAFWVDGGFTVTIPTGIDRLTAAFIPNMRPSLFRGRDQLGRLGVSDYHEIEPLFDALDETYASWMRDIRLGRGRLLVPRSMLDNMGPGEGAAFDVEQEIFTPIDAMGKPGDGMPIMPSQFTIRWGEHQQTARELTQLVMRSAGYASASVAGADPGTSATATEVTDRNRMTERTRDKKANYWRAGLAHIAAAMLDLDVAVFGGDGDRIAATELPEVRFQAETQVDPEKIARTAQLLRGAEAASTETLVRMVHPEWDGPTINDEVARITAMSGTDVPSPEDVSS